MQPLNHDMDQLIKKAAKNYPLRSWDGDWDAVSSRIQIVPRKTSGWSRILAFVFIWIVIAGIMLPGGMVYIGKNLKHSGALSAVNSHVEPVVSGDPSARKIISFRNLVGTTSELASTSSKNGISTVEGLKSSFAGEILPVNDRSEDANEFLNEFPARKVSFANGALTFRPMLLPLTDHAEDLGTDNTINPRLGRFYGGISAGPQFSEACSQGISKVGYNAGVLVGYKLRSKFSLESGILYSVRKFYTDGKFFDTKKIGSTMPAGVEIMEVDVQGALLEFPLRLRYDIVKKRRSDWFVSGGLSAHIYLKEKNHYLTKMNGAMENKIGTYDQVACSGLSLINISAGYDYSINRITKLRIEPYIKIPVRKVGMGKLPVFNSGVTVALTSQFKRQ